MNDDLRMAVGRNLHLKNYISKINNETGEIPDFHHRLTRDYSRMKMLNLIYPIGDPVFVHVFNDLGHGMKYTIIEPELNNESKEIYEELLDIIFIAAGTEAAQESKRELEELLEKIIDNYTKIIPQRTKVYSRKNNFTSGAKAIKKIEVTLRELMIVKYYIKQKLMDNGILEPLLRDPYIEDITCVGQKNFHIIHKIFGSLQTNLRFTTEDEQNDYYDYLTEKIGRTVSPSRPILDATMPDGSRLNLVYSKDVSLKGPTMSIRKFLSEPFGISQLVKWGTMSEEIAAYLWLCLEFGMSIFICGESASGKTSTMNSILPFIRYDSKIYSCEDTTEITPPHKIWQQLLTRDVGLDDSRVDMYSLLKAALRSRPNYIIVGEIRGPEGAVAFQAMQTGHPVLSTFHSSSVTSMIQRFTGHPINVPVRFMDNLNIVIHQNTIYRNGRTLRRITSIDEIISYSEELNGILTRNVFTWNPGEDIHRFRGRNNSYILEDKIERNLGYKDKRKIYQDLDLRVAIIREMINQNILNYSSVLEVIQGFQMRGIDSLPFSLNT